MNKTALRQALASGAALAVAAVQPAFAQATGGVDPENFLTQLVTWGLVLAGIVIPGICAWNGVQAVAQGQNLGRYIGYGIGGMALCFGGAYILSQGGINAVRT